MEDTHAGGDAVTRRDEWKDQRCTCGHERGVHAGHDGLGRCVLRSCPTICGAFALQVGPRPRPRPAYGWGMERRDR